MTGLSTIASALRWAKDQFSSINQASDFDAEILLAYVLDVTRIYLIAHPDTFLSSDQQAKFAEAIRRCAQGEPVAYITGRREFWSLDFKVTKDTLIPRPETELLVGLVLETLSDGTIKTIADLGTGSGAVALAIAKERPQWQIYATDIIPATLEVAKQNAANLKISNVIFSLGDWYAALPDLRFDALISNPPYIAKNDNNIAEKVHRFEPHQALYAGDDGLKALRILIHDAGKFLRRGGYLFLEHGFEQAELIRELLINANYSNICLFQDLAGLDRVTYACKNV